MNKIFYLVCTSVVVFSISVCAQDKEKESAIKLVKNAVKYVSEQGVAKAIEELNKANGQFVAGSLNVFAYDTNGIMVAHPKNPKLIGMNLLDVPDADGKLFRKEIIEIAKKRGSGWVDYKYKNPSTAVIESKTTYIQKAGALVLCCGIYKK